MITHRACRGSRVGCKSLENAGGKPATTRKRAVTIIEMLVVIMVIFILAALVLAASSYVQNKGARARAGTEIAAISAALESYKADNGIYPRQVGGATDTLNPRVDINSSSYQAAGLFLYTQLSGDLAANRQPTAKSYFSFPPRMLSPKGSANSVTALVDPWGNSYGYSTAQAANPGGTAGYNPTYDLWSNADPTPTPTATPTPTPQDRWIKNW